MAALLAVVPLTGIYPFFLMQALCFALFACAFNLLLGYVGLLSFGHAMFLGTPAMSAPMPQGLGACRRNSAILAGARGSALLGVVTGALAIRRQGIYFAMITLASRR